MFASEIVVSRTSTASRGEFEIPDFELRRIKAWGEDRHLQMLAIFHSHPSGDYRLSAADRAALRHSEWPWLIVTRSRARDAPVVLTGYRPGDERSWRQDEPASVKRRRHPRQFLRRALAALRQHPRERPFDRRDHGRRHQRTLRPGRANSPVKPLACGLREIAAANSREIETNVPKGQRRVGGCAGNGQDVGPTPVTARGVEVDCWTWAAHARLRNGSCRKQA
jgi:proteasome lid subunit RPN8/RPN11